MAYLSKKTLLAAYKSLSTLSDNPSAQGATQKVSAIRYVLALDMFCKLNGRECDTRNSGDRSKYVDLVNMIVAISPSLFTTNFFHPLAIHQGDCSVASNFYSVGAVKESLTNETIVIPYPRRGTAPLFEIQAGKLFERSSMIHNIGSYISEEEHKVALALWILRADNVNEGNIYNYVVEKYKDLFSEEVCARILPREDTFYNYIEITCSNDMATISSDDVLSLFTASKPINKNQRRHQLIFFGAPGTGKSHEVKRLTKELLDSGEKVDLPNVFRTTFHPDTDYASFVGCYKPTMKPTSKEEKTLTGKDEEIVYEYVPQVFTDAYVYAYSNPTEQTYLVIEEINRGNCAQIFGDLFQLLDRKNGVSEYTIKADKDLAKHLVDVLGADSAGIQNGKLCLPDNLHILATMNTSDQSLFPMDSAFKRRWEWEYVPINYGDDVLSGSFEITIDDKTYPWVAFIQKVNEKIFDLTQSEDKQMGNFFIKNSIGKDEFKSKVMFYLWYEVLRDETGNNKYFFRQNTPDGKDSTPFTFKDLYETDAQETIQQFMAYLGVAPK